MKDRIASHICGTLGCCVILTHAAVPIARQPMANRKQAAYVQQVLRSRLPLKWHRQARPIAQTLLKESHRYGIDPIFVLAIIRQESSFDPLSVGSHGERGLMQILPATARWIARVADIHHYNLFNPESNIKIGIAYLQWLRRKLPAPNREVIAAAYNMGPAAIHHFSTQHIAHYAYARSVLRHYIQLERWILEPSFKYALTTGHLSAKQNLKSLLE